MECKHCGTSNSPSANFCQGCGQAMLSPSAYTSGQAATPTPQHVPAAGQAVAKNNARISEVTFFSTPERPEHSKVRYESHTLEFIIIFAAILLGIAAYFWVEQSNVVKRLGEPAAVKQQQAVSAPQPLRKDATPRTDEARLKQLEPPEKIEPPEMGHNGPQPPVVTQQQPIVAPHHRIVSGKFPPAAPVTVEQQPEPSANPVVEPAPVQPAQDNAVAHAAEAAENPDDASERPVTEPSAHHKDASKSHQPSLSRNEETVKSADQVKEFLKKWGESIKQGETHPNCTQQARALNQCH